MRAGLMGLAFAVLFLLVVLTTIVFISNRVTGHHDESATATQQR